MVIHWLYRSLARPLFPIFSMVFLFLTEDALASCKLNGKEVPCDVFWGEAWPFISFVVLVLACVLYFCLIRPLQLRSRLRKEASSLGGVEISVTAIGGRASHNNLCPLLIAYPTRLDYLVVLRGRLDFSDIQVVELRQPLKLIFSSCAVRIQQKSKSISTYFYFKDTASAGILLDHLSSAGVAVPDWKSI
jgi:hypothetical protein